MSSSLYSTHTIRSDRVNFIHQTGHTQEKDVIFNTSGKFDFQKPIEAPSFLMHGKYRLFIDEPSDKLLVQKKIGGVFQTKFSFSFS